MVTVYVKDAVLLVIFLHEIKDDGHNPDFSQTCEDCLPFSPFGKLAVSDYLSQSPPETLEHQTSLFP